MVYLGNDKVVKDLQDECHDDSKDGGDKCHLHTLSYNSWRYVASFLNIVEGHHHANHRSEESQRRSNGDEEPYPRATTLQACRLKTAVAHNVPLHSLHVFASVQQALVTHRCNRSPSIAAQALRPFQVALFYMAVNVLHQASRLYLRERKVNDSLYAERQTQYEGYGNERHKLRLSFHELCLQLLVQSCLQGSHLLQGLHLVIAHHLTDIHFRHKTVTAYNDGRNTGTIGKKTVGLRHGRQEAKHGKNHCKK